MKEPHTRKGRQTHIWQKLRKAAAALYICWGVTNVHAELTWKQTEVVQEPTPPTTVAKFEAQNTGDQPVFITRIQKSCSCTTARASGTEIPPGGNLTITVETENGSDTKASNKLVLVETTTNKQILRQTITGRENFSLSKTRLQWKADAKPQTTTLIIKNPAFQFVSATSLSPDFKVESTPGETPETTNITISPNHTNGGISGARIDMIAAGKPIHAYVRLEAQQVTLDTGR